MLGDAQTVSDEDNHRASRPSDAPTGWPPTQSPDGLDHPIGPSWGNGWATMAAEVVEPNVWDAPEPVRADPAASEPGGFAGWSGLSSTDQSPVSHDLTAWDSPFDAVVAEAAEAPGDLDPTVEVPLWGAEPSTTPSVSAWPSLPNPPSSAASAWAPGTLSSPLDEAPQAANDHAADGAVVAAPLPMGTATSFTPTMGSWSPSPDAPGAEHRSTGHEVSVDEAAGLAYTGVPFHQLAAALAASDPVPVAEPIPASVPATPSAARAAAADHATGGENTPPKRRGRLAARSPQRHVPAVEVEADVVAHVRSPTDPGANVADDAELAEPVRMNVDSPFAVPTPAEHLAAGSETDELPVFESSAGDAVTDEATESPRSRSFFAKRDPRETAASSRETPKVLRIAAVVSLLIGLGLFGYSVLTSRSSDTKPSDVTTVPAPVAPSAEAPTTAPVAVATPSVAPIGEAETVTELAPDPIFGSAPATPSAATAAEDPIFGSDRAVASSGAPGDAATTPDPLFGTLPAVPSPDGEANGTDELSFEQSGTARS